MNLREKIKLEDEEKKWPGHSRAPVAAKPGFNENGSPDKSYKTESKPDPDRPGHLEDGSIDWNYVNPNA